MSVSYRAAAPADEASEPAGFVAAVRRLRSAQKSSKGAPLYSLYVNRPLGRVFAAAAYQVRLTPNQVTGISAVFTFTGIAALALLPAQWWVGLLVAGCLVLGYALDSADGQLARLRGGGSRTGEWLDHMIDSAKICSLHLAVLITMARSFSLEQQAWLLVPMVFCVASVVNFFGMLLVELLVREHRAATGQARPAPTRATPVRSMLKIPTDYGVLCLAFALLGAPALFLGVYTFLAAGTLGYLSLIVVKWYRDVSRLDRSQVAS